MGKLNIFNFIFKSVFGALFIVGLFSFTTMGVSALEVSIGKELIIYAIITLASILVLINEELKSMKQNTTKAK